MPSGEGGHGVWAMRQMQRLPLLWFVALPLLAVSRNLVATVNTGFCRGTDPRCARLRGAQIHMMTACGILYADHRAPSLEYGDLLPATWSITGHAGEVERRGEDGAPDCLQRARAQTR